ncbi:SDR family oxidoreductase [Parasphingorhabdus sp.]|uniref:SDR family NAD(P)-dependent oxidoreductase n=1 Tax=Parasphingorhabdus sp. TaxID=2709688 RepID=UPI0032671AFB
MTGATGYLGREMCWALARAGAEVLVNSRIAEKAEAFAAELRQAGFAATPAPFDVVDEEAITAFVDSRAGSPLHVLVNNAYAGVGGTIETSNSEQFRTSYEMTVISANQILQATLPLLRGAIAESGDASVINICSMYGVVSPDLRVYETPEGSNPPFYGAAKAAFIQYTRYAACEFGPEGLRVNAIAPGPFPSHSVQEADPQFVKTLAAKVPMRRIGSAAEIGGPVVFLASSLSTYVNGAVLPVDGGWTAW